MEINSINEFLKMWQKKSLAYLMQKLSRYFENQHSQTQTNVKLEQFRRRYHEIVKDIKSEERSKEMKSELDSLVFRISELQKYLLQLKNEYFPELLINLIKITPKNILYDNAAMEKEFRLQLKYFMSQLYCTIRSSFPIGMKVLEFKSFYIDIDGYLCGLACISSLTTTCDYDFKIEGINIYNFEFKAIRARVRNINELYELKYENHKRR